MKKIILSSVVAGAVLFCIYGCASVDEIVGESDLSVEEIEAKKSIAIDPDGRYASSTTSVMRQEVRTKMGWLDPDKVQMVEAKYEAPGNFKIITYEENAPVYAIIINQNQAWSADYSSQSVVSIPQSWLNRVKILEKMSDPRTKLKDVFAEVRAEKVLLDDETFYKLICINPDEAELSIYIDARDFLPRRITGFFNVNGSKHHYDSRIEHYGMYEGVRIPDESIIIQNGLEQTSKVIYYKLDVIIPQSEFRPPVF